MSRVSDSQIVRALFGIVAVLVLIIPAMTGYLAENQKRTIILGLPESDYASLTYLHASPINQTAFTEVYGDPDVNETDADTVLINNGINNWSYTDDVIVIGDNNTANFNYSVIPITVETIYIGLDITGSEIIEKDFLVFDSTLDTTKITLDAIALFDGFNMNWFYNSIETVVGRYIMPISTTMKTSIASYPDDTVYLAFTVWDDSETTFEFTVYVADIPSTIWAWDDFQLYTVSLMASIVISVVAIVFATDTIDVVIDRKRKSRK